MNVRRETGGLILLVLGLILLLVLASVLGCGRAAIERVGMPTAASVWPSVRADVIIGTDSTVAQLAAMDAAVRSGDSGLIWAQWVGLYPDVIAGIEAQGLPESVRTAKLERARRFDALVAVMRGGGL
jgi:hypothetical protein